MSLIKLSECLFSLNQSLGKINDDIVFGAVTCYSLKRFVPGLRISLEIMTLQPRCEDVETAEGVAITVTGVAQARKGPLWRIGMQYQCVAACSVVLFSCV